MLQHPMTTHKTLRTLLLCALYAFLLLFFLSSDSYLRDIFGHFDSAWFFMCGKAWMNGLTPYVDFADSKGPLLWLIYGLGYLISHHSYIGVFWISVAFYTATLFIAYKLSRLFLEPRPSALCVAILPLALFYYEWHCEVIAEDYCYLFTLISLYCLCRIIGDESLPKRKLFLLSIALGLCFSACLLIKWNIAGMIGSTLLCVFILSFKRKAVRVCLGGMIGGAVVLALPFVIYFLAFADFGTMVNEYFVNTYLTMDGRTNAFEMLTFGRLMLVCEKLTIILFIGLLLFCRKRWRYAWLIFCFFIFRIGMGLAFQTWRYYANLMPFFLFFLIAVVGYLYKKWPLWLNRLTPALCILAVIGVIACDMKTINANFRHAKEDREMFYVAAYVMSQVEKPKVLFFNLCIGMGTPVDELPACRYWTRQLGATDQMLEEREQALRDRKADFVVMQSVLHATETVEEVSTKIEAQGYVPYVVVPFTPHKMTYTLYGRPGLKLPPPDFHVSQWDVWLKRNIFGI